MSYTFQQVSKLEVTDKSFMKQSVYTQWLPAQ